MIVHFRTETEIPLEAFSLLGVNAKTSKDAIGRFGTGLKYAVAVILRNGGKIRLFVGPTEYEFYLADKRFRDKLFQQVRMRKRHGSLSKWMSSKALPFTTEFGKDWQLWQAFRELESNTRDEGGSTMIFEPDTDYDPIGTIKSGTSIIVDCPGFAEQIREAHVFLPKESDRGKVVLSNSMMTIYDRPSKYLYYQGIRVYDLRYPARLTYDFKSPMVILTEDRTAGNAWALMNYIASALQSDVADIPTLKRILSKSKDQSRFEPTFESQDLNFDFTKAGSESFAYAAESLNRQGYGGKAVSGYYGSRKAYIAASDEKSISLPRRRWDSIAKAIKEWSKDGYPDSETGVACNALLAKLDHPFF